MLDWMLLGQGNKKHESPADHRQEEI